MSLPDRIVYTAASAFARAAGAFDSVHARAVQLGRGATTLARYLGPGVALAHPLRCGRCHRNIHYLSQVAHDLKARGVMPRCWLCGGPLADTTPHTPTAAPTPAKETGTAADQTPSKEA